MAGVGFYFWLIAGSIALWIEAHRQFYHPENRGSLTYGRYPVLSGVGVEELSPARIQARGYFFYVASYLALYLLFVLTTELGDIVLRVATSQQQSGPQDIYAFTDGSAAPIRSQGETRPLAIALAMITLQSLGAVRRVEIILRNFAHRLAGIPHSVYRMIRRLNEIDYSEAMRSGTCCKLFDAYLAALPAEARALFSKDDLQAIRADLRVIDALEPSTVGTFRDQVFPIENVKNLDDLIERQKADNEALENRLRTPPETVGPDEVRALMAEVQLAARNLKALFAVLFSRTPDWEIAEVHPPTTLVVQKLKGGDTTLLRDSVLLALVTSTIVAFFFSIALDAALRVNAATPESLVVGMLLDDCVLTYDTGSGAGSPYACQTNKPIDPDSAEDGAATDNLAAASPPPSWAQRFRTTLAAEWALLSANAVNDTVQASVAMLFAMLAALTARLWRIDFETWNSRWSFTRFPIKQMLLTSLLPALIGAAAGVGALVTFDVIIAWTSSGVRPEARDLASFVNYQLYAFPRLLVLSLILSVTVLVVADQYARKPAWRTITITAILSGLFLGLLWLFWVIGVTFGLPVGSDAQTAVYVLIEVRSAALLSLYAWLTAILFAVFVEMGEDPETKARSRAAEKDRERARA
jgi:hypothetical protein